MLRRFFALFRRYADAHGRVEGRPETVYGTTGDAVGRVERIVFEDNRILVRGVAQEGPIILTSGTAQVDTKPADGGNFVLGVPLAAGRQQTASIRIGACDHHPLSLPDMRLVQVRLFGRFVATMIRLLPNIIGWGWSHDPRHRQAVKRGLGLHQSQDGRPLAPQIFATGEPPEGSEAPAPTEVVILLPVHNAHDMVSDCLDRVRAHTDVPWVMYLINDSSTDPRIAPMLQAFADAENQDQPGRVRLRETPQNLGFVGAVNMGFEDIAGAGGEAPVILLNSDAMVPAGWASRLVAPLLADASVASVTPMSNDAEIFSAPVICAPSALPPGQVDTLDAMARRLHRDIQLAEAPTGVGFCMAMARSFLRQVPAFDTVFGRGYGEEVDWCQKTRALGGRHVCTAQLFVEHSGGASFGSEEKQAAVLNNNRIVAKRYPTYDADVQRFLKTDPLISARVTLAMEWAGLQGAGPVPVYLAHSLGGGADRWLQAKILETEAPAIVLRVGGEMRWHLEVHDGRGGRTIATTDDFEQVAELIALLPARRIVYSCGVGDLDPQELPICLLRLKSGSNDRIEVLFHDYLPISPRYTLLDEAGQFHGPVTSQTAGAAHEALTAWQASWGQLLQAADAIRVFSQASAALVAAVWPDLEARIVVHPHSLLDPVPKLTPLPDRPPVIGVLGNIAPHKGAALLQTLATRLGRSGQPGLVLLGQIDPRYPLPRSVRQHGSYQVRDLPELVQQYGITHWLIPSVWPETFSYATHEALATGLPVMAFDIGAQGEAVAAAANGEALRYTPDGDLAQQVMDGVARLTVKTETAG